MRRQSLDDFQVTDSEDARMWQPSLTLAVEVAVHLSHQLMRLCRLPHYPCTLAAWS